MSEWQAEIDAHLAGIPIQIKFLAGKRVWEDYPKHWKGLEAFRMKGYAFRIKSKLNFLEEMASQWEVEEAYGRQI